MFRNTHLILAGLLTVLDISSSRPVSGEELPFWEASAVQGALNDTFYTTYFNEFLSQITSPNISVPHGVAAWIACSVDGLHGPNNETPNAYNPSADLYHGYNADMNFTCAQPGSSTPLYRFYKGAPQHDHVYVTTVSQANNLEALGYHFDRVEGYVYTTNIFDSNLVLLHSLSLGAGTPNQEIDRRYTVNPVVVQSLVNAGWTDEGSVGFVYSTSTKTTINPTGYTGYVNGYAVTPTGSVSVPITNVVPPTGTYPFENSSFESNKTHRPTGAVWQQITFRMYTGTLFSDPNFSHVPVYLHYQSQPTNKDLSFAGVYSGIALVIGKAGDTYQTGTCVGSSSTGQFYFELGSGRPFTSNLDLLCDPQVSGGLQANTYYDINFQLNDSAQVKVAVSQYNPSTGVDTPLIFNKTGTSSLTDSLSTYFSCPLAPPYAINKSYCGNPFSYDGFAVNDTGYDFHPLYSGSPNSSVTISGVNLNWLNSAGTILH